MPPAHQMLSSLLRPNRRSPVRRVDSPLFNSNPNTPSPGDRPYNATRHATADFTEVDEDDDEDDDDQDDLEGDFDDEDEQDQRHRMSRHRLNPEGRRGSGSLVPLFSASYLDALPVYSIVHSIRTLVQSRTETTLTWDQLRSPQVSQFLVKPIQQQIRTHHFNRATMYALMANSLQFAKEAQLYPGNAGTSSTRAKVCELLALKLLKEYSTRELIDALSYDFFPLQGITPTPANLNLIKTKPTTARSSTLEVAIRASAKHFLAHPLVVQQLEAIWNGAITFYSYQDNLHRVPKDGLHTNRNQAAQRQADARTPLLGADPTKMHQEQLPLHSIPLRRTVALYDPRNASPLKLSRLRVPRYRQFLSTCSLCILICLFLAVLVERSSRITSLELIFWFWSAGFMLDEVVGFNEQGFSLYIMSFWNIFDLGILLMLILYYCMRVYGIFLVETKGWNDMAYDVLAANAILLLPRIFSVLDHYPYFSQLLIAFRLMAVDLAAVFVLVLISCSGFFVFFTLSSNQNDAAEVSYKIFQILMGFTPAAWDVWFEYTYLGRALLVAFLIMCHFVVVTILITVLTNSFMSIASNAKQEHQFLFAINTISMVKNDALFSYIAPGNIVAWMLMPLRYIMSIQHFVLLNRQAIKITHFPLLFCIFFYEKYFLASAIYEPTDLVERQGRIGHSAISFNDPARNVPFSPKIRVQEESSAGLQKDRALDEVFRRPPGPSTFRSQRRQEKRKTQTAIRNWMDQNDEDDGASMARWPTIETRPSLSGPRLNPARDISRRFRTMSDVRSTASDPAELMSNNGFPTLDEMAEREQEQEDQIKDQMGADGDDELVTNDEDEDEDERMSKVTNAMPRKQPEDYFSVAPASKLQEPTSASSSASAQIPTARASPKAAPQPKRQGIHSRTLSTNTILYAPRESNRGPPSPSTSSEEPMTARSRPRTSRIMTTIESSAPAGTRSPRKTQYPTTPTRPKPIPAPKPTPHRVYAINPRTNRHASSVDVDINSDIMGLDLHPDLAHVSSSFATQMAMATGQLKGLGQGGSDRDNSDRMSRLVLARMKTLEEGFADVVKEMRGLRSVAPTAHNSGEDWQTTAPNSDEGGRDSRSKRTSWGASGGSNASKGAKGGERSAPSSMVHRPGMAMVHQNRRKGKGKGKESKSRPPSDDEAELGHKGSSF